jgi:membrane-associated phospholipid phosphatase
MRTLPLLLLLLSPSLLVAGGEDSTAGSILEKDFLATLRGTGRYLSSPFRQGGVNWYAVGGVAAATGGMMFLDEKIREEWGVAGREDYNGDWWDVPTFYGSIAGAAATGVAVYTLGFVTTEPEVRLTGRLAIQALISGAIAETAVKFIAGRARPYTEEGPHSFLWFETADDHHSFPSGHTMAAFALSTVFAERIGTTWSRIGFYSLATLTGLSRIKNDQHWASDVVLGAAIGFSAGWEALRGEEEGAVGSGFELLPSGGGLTLLYRLP